jgi:tetratricopeptide (TPR) repeat protein
MKHIINKVLVIYLVLFGIITESRASTNKQDSLMRRINTEKNDSIKIDAYLELGYLLEQSNPDSSLKIYDLVLQGTEKFSESTKNYFWSRSYNSKGIVLTNMGKYDEAFNCLSKAIISAEKNNDKQQISDAYNNRAFIFFYKADYEKAVKEFIVSLKYKEEIGDKAGIAKINNNLGSIYGSRKEYDKSIIHFNKALKVKIEQKDESGMALCYNNIGMALFKKSEMEKIKIR